jgi:hypothetical protein|tara:strand:+ start:746 stop:922 length:177 start_codon:yes stop_codon:yes gene_type:complete
MEKDLRALTRQIHEMCWYMRGSISLSEAWMMESQDRADVFAFVKDNMERYKKSMVPVV